MAENGKRFHQEKPEPSTGASLNRPTLHIEIERSKPVNGPPFGPTIFDRPIHSTYPDPIQTYLDAYKEAQYGPNKPDLISRGISAIVHAVCKIIDFITRNNHNGGTTSGKLAAHQQA